MLAIAAKMPNRIRPRCPTCDRAMSPVYCKGPRGVSFIRIKDHFWCPDDHKMAAGRKKTAFLEG